MPPWNYFNQFCVLDVILQYTSKIESCVCVFVDNLKSLTSNDPWTSSALHWMCVTHCHPAPFLRWTLTLSGLLGGGVFGRSWRWSPHKWNQCLYKRDPESFVNCFHHLRTRQDDDRLSVNQEADVHQTPDLPVPWSWTSQPPGLGEIKFCLGVTQSVLFLLQQPEWTQKSSNKIQQVFKCPRVYVNFFLILIHLNQVLKSTCCLDSSVS